MRLILLTTIWQNKNGIYLFRWMLKSDCFICGRSCCVLLCHLSVCICTPSTYSASTELCFQKKKINKGKVTEKMERHQLFKDRTPLYRSPEGKIMLLQQIFIHTVLSSTLKVKGHRGTETRRRQVVEDSAKSERSRCERTGVGWGPRGFRVDQHGRSKSTAQHRAKD